MKNTFNHEFTAADSRTYREHTFDVPDGTQQVDFTIERYQPYISEGQEFENQVNFTVFDGLGNFRGTASCQEGVQASISAHAATPGFMPGALPAGEWTLIINIFRVLPPSTLKYSLGLTMRSEETLPPAAEYKPAVPSPRGAGWYAGDLHSHTFHSDGHWSVAHINKFYRRLGMDFLHLSDHNTISGNQEHRALSDENFIGLGGLELTTPWGHAVVVGVQDWQDWGVRNTQPAFRPIAQALKDAGHFVTIAHPKYLGEPYCGGCRWIYQDDVSDLVSGVEIWNGLWAGEETYNQEALDLYYQWLNQGRRLSATCGTDVHGMPDFRVDEHGKVEVHWYEQITDAHIAAIPVGMRLPGAALNMIWVEEFSEAGILAGLKAGRSYVSDGPRLQFTGEAEGAEAVMLGGYLPREAAVTFQLEWQGCAEGDTIRLIIDGSAVESLQAAGSGSHAWHLASGRAAWCTVEVRNAKEHLRALTNPIYFK